eukprot:TRINITY_DN44916_c0_g1_i1.p1 TRINITY_DN44916_c0_g1~~TRINITY_DN44916_c0_g1_i1.p1  ORF type:complete len:467 (+),score=82.27 TRINITY_DN44916_c0_g1_i1:67-1467(+)
MASLQDRYQKLEKIGEGSCGVVFRCRDRDTGRIVAIKKVRFSYDGEGGEWLEDGNEDNAVAEEVATTRRVFGAPAAVLREVSLLRSLGDHRHVVKLLATHVDASGRLFMVLEFVERDLRRHMDDAGRLHPLQAKRYAFQLLSALEHCHAHRVVHRDIKPQNVLVSSETDEAKLCDFSLARQHVVNSELKTKKVASLWYRSPEIFLGGVVSGIALDIWSLGCVLAEMLTHTPTFPGTSEIQMLFLQFQLLGTPTEHSWPDASKLPYWSEKFPRFQVRSGAAALSHATGSDGVSANLLAAMLCCNPEHRQSASVLLSHAYFYDLDRTLHVRQGSVACGGKQSASAGSRSMTSAEKPGKETEVTGNARRCNDKQERLRERSVPRGEEVKTASRKRSNERCQSVLGNDGREVRNCQKEELSHRRSSVAAEWARARAVERSGSAPPSREHAGDKRRRRAHQLKALERFAHR